MTPLEDAMFLIKQSNWCFIHVPKTAGTWVHSVFQDQDLIEKELPQYWHLDSIESKQIYPDRRFLVFVRHPLDWYRSYFADRVKKGWGGDLAIAHVAASDDFARFISAVVRKTPGFLAEVYERYTRYADWIGRLEDLPSNLSQWLDEELKISLAPDKLAAYPRLNVADHLPSWKGLKPLAKRLLEAERKILDKYDYPLFPDRFSEEDFWQ